MKIGTSVVAEVILYKVEIEGRGGDSVHDAFFETEEGAIFASALDGQNRTPTPECVLKLSDGTYIHYPKGVGISKAPTEEEMQKIMDKLPPAVKLLLRRTK